MFSRAARPPVAGSRATANPTAAYVAPMLVIALATMITGALAESGFDRFYAVRVLAGARRPLVLPSPLRGPRGVFSWQAVAVGMAVWAIWTALEPAPSSSEVGMAMADTLARMPRAWAGSWLAARAIGSVIIVPLAEELAFRGYLTRRLIAADFQTVTEGRFTWPSFLLSSLLFGLLHQRLARRHGRRDGLRLGLLPQGQCDRCRHGPRDDESLDHHLRLRDRRMDEVVVSPRGDEARACSWAMPESLASPDGSPPRGDLRA